MYTIHILKIYYGFPLGYLHEIKANKGRLSSQTWVQQTIKDCWGQRSRQTEHKIGACTEEQLTPVANFLLVLISVSIFYFNLFVETYG